MASSGVVYGSRKVNQWGPRLELHWDITSQSVKDNTSTIRVRSYFNVNGTINWSARSYEGNTRINDGTRNTYYYTSSNSTQRHRLMNTSYHTIKHKSDGTATVSLEGWFNVKVLNWSGVNVSEIYAQGNITLNKIIRGIDNSSASLSYGWKEVIGSKQVTFTKLSSTARVELAYSYYNSKNGNWSDTKTINSDYTSGSSFYFLAEDINKIHIYNPNSRTTSFRIILRVYQSNTLIDTITKNADLNLKVEVPSISGTVIVSGKNQSLLGDKLYAVENIHTAKIEISATAKNGASIKSYEINFQEQKYNTKSTSVLITKSGHLAISIKATDSRGFTYSKILESIISRSYSPPSLSNHRAFRVENSVENPLGKIVRVNGNIESTEVLNKEGKNINTPYWRISFDNSNTFKNKNIYYSKSIGIENSPTYTLYFGDAFSDLKVPGQVPSGQASLVLGKESVGINIVPSEGAKGLYLKDDLINNLKVALMYDFYADYKVYGASNYIEAIKLNWSKIKEGISFANCWVATRGVAIILKYPSSSGDYGMVLTFGYGGAFKKYIRSSGKWEERSV